jgi:hypothetical protein
MRHDEWGYERNSNGTWNDTPGCGPIPLRYQRMYAAELFPVSQVGFHTDGSAAFIADEPVGIDSRPSARGAAITRPLEHEKLWITKPVCIP